MSRAYAEDSESACGLRRGHLICLCLCNLDSDDEQGRFYSFLFRNSSFSTVFGFKRFLFLDTTSPAFEKTRSQGTEDAGVHKNVSASSYKV